MGNVNLEAVYWHGLSTDNIRSCSGTYVHAVVLRSAVLHRKLRIGQTGIWRMEDGCTLGPLKSPQTISRCCNTQRGKVVTITLPCGIHGVVIGVTKGITHGSGHDRKPILTVDGSNCGNQQLCKCHNDS